MDYKNAGVDIEAGYKSVELMKEHVKKTMREEVLGGLGGFSGAFSLAKIKEMEEPVLLSGTDGCGTKVNLAMIMDKHDTIGIDAVAMCVNDIACAGGEPLFFLDYIACGKNYPEKIASIVSGVAEGCIQSEAALIGGETAEHPGLMPEDEYDLAGFAVGVCDKKDMITGENLKDGDVLIGMASFMNRYGYSIHLRDEEQTMENSYDASVLFMAYETEMAAKMFVQYSVDSDFETVLKELYRQGVCVAIKPSAPNIDDGMLAAKIHMSRYPVKTIRRRREDPTASESVERLGSGVVSKGSAKSLLQALALCEKVLRCIRRNPVLQISATLIGLAVLTLLIFFGQSFTLPSAAIALYHLLFMLPMLLFAKLGVK